MAHFGASLVPISNQLSISPSLACQFSERIGHSSIPDILFYRLAAHNLSHRGQQNRKGPEGCSKRGFTVMSSAITASPAEGSPLALDKPVLFDFPVSNNGAQVRFVIYGKGLENEFVVQSPQAIGGMKSETYLRYNPEGKSPLLVLPSGLGIPESEVISEYIIDKYASVGPSYVPKTPELRAVSNTVKRLVDIYFKPSMGAMYRAGYTPETRSAAIAELARQLDIVERVILADPYVAGPDLSTGDFSLFAGAMIFMNYMLPAFFEWKSIFEGRPKLKKWWDTMNELELTQRVRGEVEGALQSWQESGRWEKVGILEQVADKSVRWVF